MIHERKKERQGWGRDGFHTVQKKKQPPEATFLHFQLRKFVATFKLRFYFLGAFFYPSTKNLSAHMNFLDLRANMYSAININIIRIIELMIKLLWLLDKQIKVQTPKNTWIVPQFDWSLFHYIRMCSRSRKIILTPAQPSPSWSCWWSCCVWLRLPGWRLPWRQPGRLWVLPGHDVVSVFLLSTNFGANFKSCQGNVMRLLWLHAGGKQVVKAISLNLHRH